MRDELVIPSSRFTEICNTLRASDSKYVNVRYQALDYLRKLKFPFCNTGTISEVFHV